MDNCQLRIDKHRCVNCNHDNCPHCFECAYYAIDKERGRLLPQEKGMDWEELQHDVASWAVKNFGQVQAWAPMLGLVEEVGEYFAARNSLGDYSHRDEMRDALGDQAIYVLNLCEVSGLQFHLDVARGPDLTRKAAAEELFGMVGFGCRAILKNSQGIRGFSWEKRRDQLRLSLRGWYLWASWEAVSNALVTYDTDEGSVLLPIVQQTWAQVRRRDWVKHPETAHKEVG